MTIGLPDMPPAHTFAMPSNASIQFFDSRFQRQLTESDLRLNPFEQIALPHLRGRVLDYGCGLGNLAVAATRQGCSVVALDASPAAIGHLRRLAAKQSLSIDATEADLREHEIAEDFDVVVSIGLLMFFDCASAYRQLERLQSCLRPGGVAIVNVLVEGTTYLDMFDPADHCLFPQGELFSRFAGWEILHCGNQDFPAPGERVKVFDTIVARKPN